MPVPAEGVAGTTDATHSGSLTLNPDYPVTGGTVTVQGAIVSTPVNEGPTTGGNVLTGGTKPRLS